MKQLIFNGFSIVNGRKIPFPLKLRNFDSLK